jgi:molybdopterin synthase catalytic subunit
MSFLTDSPIDQAAIFSGPEDPAPGALGAFVGIVRNHHQGRAVRELYYEGYRPMAELQIGRLVEEAAQRWKLRHVRAVHRLGRLTPGEAAVAVCVWSDHRAEAFAASRFLIDEIKRTVPIWKRETYADGASEWVRCEKD